MTFFCIFTFFIIIYIINAYHHPPKNIHNTYNEMIYKGAFGETYVIKTIQEWILENNIDAKIIPYNTPKYETQAIDLILNTYQFPPIGIEVKYRTIDHIQYLKFRDISRFHQDGSRQSTKQLFEYIYDSHRLGLYSFVFILNGKENLYFLPHYILEQIMENYPIIYINQIINHPHGYHWTEQNTDFINYIKTEYINQKNFFQKEISFT